MAAAFDGPTPGRSARTAAGAVLRFTTPSTPLDASARPATKLPSNTMSTIVRRPTPDCRPRAADSCQLAGTQTAVCAQGVEDSKNAPSTPVGRQSYPLRQSLLLEQVSVQYRTSVERGAQSPESRQISSAVQSFVGP